MVASASPSSGGHSNANGNSSGGKSNGGGGENGNGTGGGAADNLVAGPAPAALRHNPGLSLDWTQEEQSILEDLLAKYASESTVVRYAKIAQALSDKTVRDVALRCRWMNAESCTKDSAEQRAERGRIKERKTLFFPPELGYTVLEGNINAHLSETMGTLSGKGSLVELMVTESCDDYDLFGEEYKKDIKKKENGKRRKDENNSRKNKDKKEKVTDSLPKSSQVANRSNGPPYTQSTMSMDSNDGISFKAIGGAAGQLLEQNAQALDQISTNFSACKIHENINLFCQARNNIVSLLNDLSDLPEIMKQMPPLPVKLNDELANSILPRTFMPKKP
ncbi:hypothetical protein STAS_35129 [Striga asiatica]|uniref:Myb-like domain-containing protein n=1 Tax=Striga asiatica TaxID=4170 RepID=A0A5A7RJC0_STRAF|nr:hypothetical protein STAS_35129 [Striga asiatica]